MWANATSLWAMLAVAIAGLLVVWSAWRYRKAMQHFGDAALFGRLSKADPPRLRWTRSGMLVGAMALLVVALAGPRWGTTTAEVQHDGLDLVVALDVSHSMLAEDVAPSRLERSRHEIMRLVDALPGDRVGLALFAGDAFLQCPLTSDRNAVRLFLEAADPSMIPTPGTDLGRLGPVVLDAFERADTGADRARVLLVVSDGEFHSGDARTLAPELREQGIVTLAMGVGETQGARIPEATPGGESAYRRDREGNIVYTRLDEASLRTLVGEAGYVHVGRSGSGADRLIPALQRLDRAEIDVASREVPVDRYQWPLALALLLLVSERLVSKRRIIFFS